MKSMLSVDCTLLPRHRWYFIKEGFSPGFVSAALGEVDSACAVVLDPFAGCGTTLVTSRSLGHKAIGIEVNPFLVFAAGVKALPGPWHRDQFRVMCDRIMEAKEEDGISTLEQISTFSKRPLLRKWLFDLSVLRTYFASIRVAQDYGGSLAGPLRLALLGAAVECGNFKRDGKALRYKTGWDLIGLTGEDFRKAFLRRANEMIDDVEQIPLTDGLPALILEGDSREALSKLSPASVDLVITSPPYLNSFDYCDIYRPELFLGEFVTSNSELRMLRMKTIRSHVQVRWPRTDDNASAIVASYVAVLKHSKALWDKRLPDMVAAYFADMLIILRHLFRVLAPGGRVWFVVATSAYAGLQIPVDHILAELGEIAGLRLSKLEVIRSLRSSGQHWKSRTPDLPLRESMIVWEKRPPRTLAKRAP